MILIYSASPTEAYFNDQQDQAIQIEAGTWWDKSNLIFEDVPFPENLTSCTPVNINFPLQNSGFTMLDSTSFRIYKDGEVVSNGTLGIIQANQTASLSIQVDAPGNYMAEIDQRPGYGGNNREVTHTGSKAVLVGECPPPPKELEDQNKEKEEPVQEKEPDEEVINEKDVEVINEKGMESGPAEEVPELPNTRPSEEVNDSNEGGNIK